MGRRNGLEGAAYLVSPAAKWKRLGVVAGYLARIIRGCWEAWRFPVVPDVIYSASDFWPDVLPAAILHWKHPRAVWVAGLYFFAPTPWPSARDRAYRGNYRLPTIRSLAYYFSQLPAVWMLKKWADLLLVANDLDVQRLEGEGRASGTMQALYGGVDLETIDQTLPDETRRYDGCFVGRFHRQKGVIELIHIWKWVCEKKPDARLAVIGKGDVREERALREAVASCGLQRQVEILGYLDGAPKYRVLKASRVFLHTPVLDTGGMAAAEGMGCGLPVVGFDLPGYRYIYPKGMVKVPINDVKAFAEAVLGLLSDASAYQRWAKEARAFSAGWDWRLKARGVLDRMLQLKRDAP